MNRVLPQNRVFAILVLIQLVYLTQVYPYVHFHHTHADDYVKAVLSVHPLDTTQDDHEDHRSNDHSHEGDDHVISATTFVQPRSQDSRAGASFVHPLAIQAATVDPETPLISLFEKPRSDTKPFEKALASTITCRGPPNAV